MTSSHLRRIATALFAAISLLFAQMAVASYACPGLLKVVSKVESKVESMAAMAHCSAMDMVQPALCQAYDHVGQQSLDKPDLPHVAPFQASGLVLIIARPAAGIPPPVSVVAARFLACATAPPVAVRHCCFRL
jgi:hypothetical protein